MFPYTDQIMTKSHAPSSSVHVSNLITNILKEKGWEGTEFRPVSNWHSDGMKFPFDKFYYKWKKENRTLTYYYCNIWNKDPLDDLIITDLMYSGTISLWPEFFGFYHCDFEYRNTPPVKKINYLTNRVENSRLKILYSLYDLGLIERCNISLNGLQPNGSLAKLPEHHENCPAQEFFQPRIPFRNWNESLEQSVIDCEITLVHETTFDSPMKLLSDKTWRALQLPRPFVIFGCPGIIKWLKQMGFDVSEKFIGHEYDAIQDHDSRRKEVLSSVLRFKWNNNMIEELENTALNNRKLLKKLRLNFSNKLETELDKL